MKRTPPKGKRFTADTAREKGRRGGVASGEARRVKRTMREWAELMRDNPAPDKLRKALGEDLTQAGAAVAAMYTESMSGNVQAFRALSDLLGETDAPAVEMLTALGVRNLTDAELASIAGVEDANGKR